MMKSTPMKNAFTLFVVTLAMLSMAGCASKTGISTNPVAVGKNSDGSLTARNANQAQVVDPVFVHQQLIQPKQEIVKDMLQVSYTMKAVRSQHGYLLKLSLIFRNLKNHSVNVSPAAELDREKGLHVKPYSRKALLSYLARRKSEASVEEKELANSNWLKSGFRIPANGIEIGELVFAVTDLKLPMNLVVMQGKHRYEFDMTEPLVVNEKKSAATAH